MKLSPRLECVANFVQSGARIADIGTDHALIPIYLMLNNKIQYAVASDINSGPLEKAKINIAKYNMEDKIKLRLASGLNGIGDNEADTAIIAGMGGELISAIISQNIPKSIETLIMQPMSNAHELRKAIFSRGFTISREMLAAEKNKIYLVICAKRGLSEAWNERDCRISPLLKNDPLYQMFIKKELKKINNAINQLIAGDDKNALYEFIKFKNWFEEELQ